MIAVAALAAAALATPGCGGGGNDERRSGGATTSAPAERPATADERRAIGEMVNLYLRALRERDAKRFCAAFSESQREFIANSQGANDCPSGQRKAWDAAVGQLGAERARRIYRAYGRSEVVDVRVTGDSASATLDVPAAAGPLSGADTVNLIRNGGRWRLDRNGGE